MDVELDAAKDAANIEKHGISLGRAFDLKVFAVVRDFRFEEERYRAYGVLDALIYCLAYTVRGELIRPISLRRAHTKEYKRHVP